MSFVNAGRAIQRFIIDMQYNTPIQESIYAVLNARDLNITIREEFNDGFLYGPGKLRQLKISFYQQQCDVVESSRITTLCTSGEQLEPKQIFFDIKDHTTSKWYTLDVGDIRYVDANYTPQQHVLAQINSIMGALEHELAYQITEKIALNKGVHLDGSEFGERVNLVNTTNGMLNPQGYFQIQFEQHKAAYNNFFVLGERQVFNWKQMSQLATDNTTLGQNYRNAKIPNLYYDINLGNVMGAGLNDPEYILVFDPQALKFVTFNRNAGVFATTAQTPQQLDALWKMGNDNVVRGALMSPRYGILWDFYARLDNCASIDGQWSFAMELLWDIVFPPVQTCNPEGVNGIMMYRTCAPVLAPCPTGDVVSPAIPTSTFTWTPGSIFPLLVSDINIGGQLSYPNVTVTNLAGLVALMNGSYIGNVTFAVDGSDVEYTGWTQLDGTINAGGAAITINFS